MAYLIPRLGRLKWSVQVSVKVKQAVLRVAPVDWWYSEENDAEGEVWVQNKKTAWANGHGQRHNCYIDRPWVQSG